MFAAAFQKPFPDGLIELPLQFTMATWGTERESVSQSSIPTALSHTVSGGGEAIPATYINELVVNLATYEQSHARDSRRRRLTSRQVLRASITRASVCGQHV